LALSGGQTPELLYQQLTQRGDAAAFQDVNVFFGDERAVPPDHDASNYRLAAAGFFHPAQLPGTQIHRMQGESADLDAEARRYEHVLEERLGPLVQLDLVLLGMGADGHTASIFPNTPAARETKRWVLAVHEGAPVYKRITLTPRTLLAARQVLVFTVGGGKREMLGNVMDGPLRPVELPVQFALRCHPNAVLVCDRSAAARLANRADP
jgi:6-phosphogluconolactonase